MSRREGLYRRLLALYPPGFRSEHADPILGTLLEGAGARGWFGESRELAGLLLGAVRASGEEAARAGRGKWRHGFAGLLPFLAVVNLAILGASIWGARHPLYGSVLQGDGGWWIASFLIAAGLLGAVSFRLRDTALVLAGAGLLLLGSEEWLHASARGAESDFSVASSLGFDGPLMLPYLLLSASLLLIAVLAWSPKASGRGGIRRAAYLFLAALVTSLLFPASLYVLLALAVIAIPLCALFGVLDRRIYGAGFGLWLVVLPYAFWSWVGTLLSDFQEPVTRGFACFLVFLPLLGLSAVVARRRRTRVA
jgi:hypothetical protein